eukprot:TRINITY_DN324_c1_g1_i1.p1 TRINITY_DN324_c1_g1~~TRINITY_DN324_c1_g1_i1.p1  ORF type:complete len:885 (+),score=330.77 TRINITY_DN324_c1_g1_i1:96-2750(+)
MESGPEPSHPSPSVPSPTLAAVPVPPSSSLPPASRLTFVSHTYPPKDGAILHPVGLEHTGESGEKSEAGNEDLKDERVEEDDEESVEREYASQFQETACIHGVLQFLRFELLLEDIPIVKIEDLEAALDEEDRSEWLDDLILMMLRWIVPKQFRRNLSKKGWGKWLKQYFSELFPLEEDERNPIVIMQKEQDDEIKRLLAEGKDVSSIIRKTHEFWDFPVGLRVPVLFTLILFILESFSVPQGTSYPRGWGKELVNLLRVQPIGYDSQDTAYYRFCRPEHESGRIYSETIDGQWGIKTKEISEMANFCDSLKGSKNKDEQNLQARILEILNETQRHIDTERKKKERIERLKSRIPKDYLAGLIEIEGRVLRPRSAGQLDFQGKEDVLDHLIEEAIRQEDEERKAAELAEEEKKSKVKRRRGRPPKKRPPTPPQDSPLQCVEEDDHTKMDDDGEKVRGEEEEGLDQNDDGDADFVPEDGNEIKSGVKTRRNLRSRTKTQPEAQDAAAVALVAGETDTQTGDKAEEVAPLDPDERVLKRFEKILEEVNPTPMKKRRKMSSDDDGDDDDDDDDEADDDDDGDEYVDENGEHLPKKRKNARPSKKYVDEDEDEEFEEESVQEDHPSDDDYENEDDEAELEDDEDIDDDDEFVPDEEIEAPDEEEFDDDEHDYGKKKRSSGSGAGMVHEWHTTMGGALAGSSAASTAAAQLRLQQQIQMQMQLQMQMQMQMQQLFPPSMPRSAVEQAMAAMAMSMTSSQTAGRVPGLHMRPEFLQGFGHSSSVASQPQPQPQPQPVPYPAAGRLHFHSMVPRDSQPHSLYPPSLALAQSTVRAMPTAPQQGVSFPQSSMHIPGSVAMPTAMAGQTHHAPPPASDVTAPTQPTTDAPPQP